MKSLILAIQFMTRVPLPAVAADMRDMAGAMRWFPLTGVIVGLAVWGGVWAGGLVDPLVAGAAGLIAWAAITGALHLDGLGDVADASGGAHKDASRISEILADPHIGSFGVVAIGLQLCAKLALLSALSSGGDLWVLPAICCIARMGPLLWAKYLAPLHEGMGTQFAMALRWYDLMGWIIIAAILCGLAPAFLVAVPATGLWALWVRSRLGGISGDSHGAGIEIVETVLLLAWLAAS
ncbi:adenosylcobinamide-GDP ribazoletransferase [Alteriqipengyuania lutimaris]|uniref:Adenosylcobinamide-GDP ribazoletransferase n=1 Tax=Alteriqipengyuania lutimaris TaxID=1538146 RepID=A0A395LKX4_9SPHN|nr:adenosylcobinamide-GDP ribazoletransferase [Alteriqipengyuania lutimaris]MBB3033618.1 adenosylcobinamide-GDP ribazoletransferase [Alteriqipengyuania lutimaris]RDS77385.1 adenosylcobinamide-GDP ribazoletransferase [Alteriqipengyuania lutimaris]